MKSSGNFETRIKFYNLKMKTHFLLLLFVTTLTAKNLAQLNSDCPQQHVPDANQICIRPDFIEGCQTYKSATQCASCLKEYQNIDGKCSIIEDNALNPVVLVGCLVESSGECLNCANGYIKKGGKCEVGIKECAEYTKDGSCALCNEEYSLMFGECRHNLLLGCKVELSDHRCSECYAPFELDSYSCGIRNCKRYNDYGCYSCECGYYITQTHSCKKYEDGCSKYNRGICTECMPHFKLRGGVCMIDGCLEHKNHMCASCKEDYELVDGTCQFKNCFDWQQGSCLVCKKGFNLVAGKCVASTGKFVCSG